MDQNLVKYQEEIDALKKHQKLLESQIKNHELLSSLLLEYHNLESIEEILDTTGKFLSSLLPNSIIMVLRALPDNNYLRIHDIWGIENSLLKKIIDLLGYELKGHDFKIIENTREIYEQTILTEVEGGLKDFSQGSVPSYVADIGQKILGIKRIYTIGIAGNRAILGNMHILMRDNSEMIDKHLIETVIYQASVAIGRLQYYYQLKESETNLKILNATKDRFFSIIAHDLRAPFQTLLSLSALLSTETEDLSQEEIKDFGKRLYDASVHQFNLLNELLEWAKIQKDDTVLSREKIHLREITESVVTSLHYTAVEKNIKIDNNIDENILAFADSNMIKLVMRNLLINAIKFSNINNGITISSVRKNEFIMITVEDHGIGIANEDIDKLFRMDIRYTTEGTESEKGTGLGLQLCKGIIEKHGGNIWVESQIGKGSKFIFTLPINSNIHSSKA